MEKLKKSNMSGTLLKKNSPETIPSPKELIGMFFKWAEPSNTRPNFACIYYISGLTEPLSRLLRNNGIRVVTKPHKTLQQEFPSPKIRPPIDLQTNVVYKISCNDCSWNYIGKTSWRYFTSKNRTYQECQELFQRI